MFLKTVVFYMCVAVAAAQYSRFQPKPEKFKNVEGCYIPTMDAVIPFGTSATWKKECIEYFCTSYDVLSHPCAIAMYDLRNKPNCYIFEDHEKPFPGCCPRIKCDDKSDSANKI